MSVIAVTRQAIVVDSRVTSGNGYFSGNSLKWVRRGDEVLAGVGVIGRITGMLQEYERTGKIEQWYGGDGDEIVRWTAKGRLFLMDAPGSWFELDFRSYAFGSGGPLALGALEMGATALQAAKIACRIDGRCGFPLHEFSRGTKGNIIYKEHTA